MRVDRWGRPVRQKATIRVASFNFSESIILAHIYGIALKNKGYTITYRDKLVTARIVEPSLEKTA